MVIRRQLEAAMKTLPLMAILFIPIIFGMRHLYSGTPGLNDGWLNAYQTDKHLVEMSHEYLPAHGSAQFLFLDGYVARAIIYFAIWLAIAFFLNRWSVEQDAPPIQNLSPRFRKIAAPGLILTPNEMVNAYSISPGAAILRKRGLRVCIRGAA